jgi:hypothetical protein
MAAGAFAPEPEPAYNRKVVPDGDPFFAERAMTGRVDKGNPARHAVYDDVVEAPDARAEGKKNGQPIPKGDFFHKNLKKWYIREYININIMFVFPIKKDKFNSIEPSQGALLLCIKKKDWICVLEAFACSSFLPSAWHAFSAAPENPPSRKT